MKRACLTSGAVYSIDVRAARVDVSVALPASARIRDTRGMRGRVHDAMEQALKIVFPGSPNV